MKILALLKQKIKFQELFCILLITTILLTLIDCKIDCKNSNNSSFDNYKNNLKLHNARKRGRKQIINTNAITSSPSIHSDIQSKHAPNLNDKWFTPSNEKKINNFQRLGEGDLTTK